MSNTNVFEHAGKVHAIAENYVPQEVDVSTLETWDVWNFDGDGDRPFSSHPKVVIVSSFTITEKFYQFMPK